MDKQVAMLSKNPVDAHYRAVQTFEGDYFRVWKPCSCLVADNIGVLSQVQLTVWNNDSCASAWLEDSSKLPYDAIRGIKGKVFETVLGKNASHRTVRKRNSSCNVPTDIYAWTPCEVEIYKIIVYIGTAPNIQVLFLGTSFPINEPSSIPNNVTDE